MFLCPNCGSQICTTFCDNCRQDIRCMVIEHDEILDLIDKYFQGEDDGESEV